MNPNVILKHSFLFPSDMRRDVQEIFRVTPHEKQVMMFSATLSKEIRPVCRKFMQDVSSLRFTESYFKQSVPMRTDVSYYKVGVRLVV